MGVLLCYYDFKVFTFSLSLSADYWILHPGGNQNINSVVLVGYLHFLKSPVEDFKNVLRCCEQEVTV